MPTPEEFDRLARELAKTREELAALQAKIKLLGRSKQIGQPSAHPPAEIPRRKKNSR